MAVEVMVGNKGATDITVVDDTKLTCKTPAHDAGKVTVSVSTIGGSGFLDDAFTFTEPSGG